MKNERGKMKEEKYILQDMNFNLRTWQKGIELITRHAQSKKVVEFHFSSKFPLISVLVLEKSFNFL